MGMGDEDNSRLVWDCSPERGKVIRPDRIRFGCHASDQSIDSEREHPSGACLGGDYQ